MQGRVTNPNVAIITASDLQRMRKEAVLITKDELSKMRHIADEQKEKQQTVAKAKKQRMTKIEDEKRRQAPVLDEFAKEELQKNDQLKMKAKKAADRNFDEVKEMEQMVNYAKAAAIRDKQLEEKKFIHKLNVEREKRLDLMLEVERLKAIQEAEEKEKHWKEQMIEGRHVIVDQMKEREMKRLKIKEEQGKEAAAMVRHMKQLEEEEKRKAIEKKHHQRIILDEIMDANHAAIDKKRIVIQAEIEEDERMMQYALEKAQKEAEYVLEQQ